MALIIDRHGIEIIRGDHLIRLIENLSTEHNHEPQTIASHLGLSRDDDGWFIINEKNFYVIDWTDDRTVVHHADFDFAWNATRNTKSLTFHSEEYLALTPPTSMKTLANETIHIGDRITTTHWEHATLIHIGTDGTPTLDIYTPTQGGITRKTITTAPENIAMKGWIKIP